VLVVVTLLFVTSVMAQQWERISGPMMTVGAVALVNGSIVFAKNVNGDTSNIQLSVIGVDGTVRQIDSTTPFGGAYQFVLVHDTLWAAARFGTWFSTDGGYSWDGASKDLRLHGFVHSSENVIGFRYAGPAGKPFSTIEIFLRDRGDWGQKTTYSRDSSDAEISNVILGNDTLIVRDKGRLWLIPIGDSNRIAPGNRLAGMTRIFKVSENFIGIRNDSLFRSNDFAAWQFVRSIPGSNVEFVDSTIVYKHLPTPYYESRPWNVQYVSAIDSQIPDVHTIAPPGTRNYFFTDREIVITDGSSAYITDRTSGSTKIIGFPHVENSAALKFSTNGDTITSVGSRICVSTNNGATWVDKTPLIHRGSTIYRQSIAFAGSLMAMVGYDPYNAYPDDRTSLTTKVSSDGGNSWHVAHGGPFVSITSSGDSIIGLTRDMIVCMPDRGNAIDMWSRVYGYLPIQQISHSMVMFASGSTLVIGEPSDVGWITNDFGNKWSAIRIPWGAHFNAWKNWIICSGEGGGIASSDRGLTWMYSSDAPEFIQHWIRTHHRESQPDVSVIQNNLCVFRDNHWDSVFTLPPPPREYSPLYIGTDHFLYAYHGDSPGGLREDSGHLLYRLDLRHLITSVNESEHSSPLISRVAIDNYLCLPDETAITNLTVFSITGEGVTDRVVLDVANSRLDVRSLDVGIYAICVNANGRMQRSTFLKLH